MSHTEKFNTQRNLKGKFPARYVQAGMWYKSNNKST
jgi:hypothetical protein